MFKPKSTYRIQFHKDFNLDDFDKIIPYLTSLNIDTIYASPIFDAVEGSTHGYDVVNPLRINPEIGSEDKLLHVSAKLQAAGINWLQDIVPNHMAFHPSNLWLMDVLEKGSESPFASYFDIDLNSGDGKLMVPFLGSGFDESLEEGLVTLVQSSGKYFFKAGDMEWPINAEVSKSLKDTGLEKLNQDKAALKQIADQQHYRLCDWQQTNTSINYRRFFTVNGLICLNIQQREVFDVYHKYIFTLIDRGVFQGLRIDHIDGLYDPKEYIDRLRQAVGKDVYIVVEKILEQGEEMPGEWKIQGTTGYDFLAQVNNLFTNKIAEKQFERTYQQVTGKILDPTPLIRTKKKDILHGHMQGELDNLLSLFCSLSLVEFSEDKMEDLRAVIGELLIGMPVYRYYNYTFPLNRSDHQALETIFQPILQDKKLSSVAKILYRALLEEPLKGAEKYNENIGRFYKRLMQFTGPLMAKGVEDTAMYTYNRFIGHSEVGDSPDSFGTTAQEFHNYMLDRHQKWPLAMNGSSTHDTKKGEDIRARLNVLTDLPGDWAKLVADLQVTIDNLKQDSPNFKWLHPNDIYMVLQTLIGALPFEDENADEIESRLEQFIQKALREAKKRSDWAAPDQAYEEEMGRFAHILLDNKYPVREKIIGFLHQIADFAVINSMGQLVLKFTCPGIPDVYQGCELWDLSLVDPDNRRPVDYTLRSEYLTKLNTAPLNVLWEQRFSGKIKLWLTKALLGIRKSQAELFEKGNYIPLQIVGKYAAHVFAFARKLEEHWTIITVPLGFAKICSEQNVSADRFDWQDTQILLPIGTPLAWTDLLSNRHLHKDFLLKGIKIAELFKELQVAVIKSVPKQNTRSAGILMPISSLASDFGIGDLGPNAYRFIDFLGVSRHRYWQILPLNPTMAEKGHSPYSSCSAMAGNVLLISPEELYSEGLIDDSELESSRQASSERINYQETEKKKYALVNEAFKKFKTVEKQNIETEFESFCLSESAWLDDYALFIAIKNHFNGQEWQKWPDAFKCKDKQQILAFNENSREEIGKIKWAQFIFFRQWNKLQKYANECGVQIIGDLPFYLDYGSVEVWSSPENFNLDRDKNMTHVAGVPPDYFNSNGQLWGMPTFDFLGMEKNGYQWWVNRLEKNLERYDLLRLDHFRAFSAYWEVDAKEQSAKNGMWKPGPGEKLFNLLRKKLDKPRLIAEDLGEITSDVERLRNSVEMPGMKVLQFAFGADLPSPPNAPHNFESTNCFVYTGTHDNNTLKGWFVSETDKDTRNRISAYFGQQADAENINRLMLNLAYSSTAETVITPLQDVLGLDGKSRINIPGTQQGNWSWKLMGQISSETSESLITLAERTGRI